MNERIKAISQEARKLTPAERAELIDELIASLDQPDPAIDALWAKEAEDRLAAYDRGEMAAHDVSEAVACLRPHRDAQRSSLSPSDVSQWGDPASAMQNAQQGHYVVAWGVVIDQDVGRNDRTAGMWPKGWLACSAPRHLDETLDHLPKAIRITDRHRRARFAFQGVEDFRGVGLRIGGNTKAGHADFSLAAFVARRFR